MARAGLKHYGWGREGEGMTRRSESLCSAATRRNLRLTNSTRSLSQALTISPCGNCASHPRLARPLLHAERIDRAARAYGKSYPDYVRAMLGDPIVRPTLWPLRATRRRFRP